MLPLVTPNWVASTDDYWEEFASAAARFDVVHLMVYEEACIWRTAEFNGPPYNPGTGSVMDRYRLELSFDSVTVGEGEEAETFAPYLKLVRTVDNGAPLIELEWCLADICGESMCLCPWFFRLKKWANVFPIEECQICVTPVIPKKNAKLCDTFYGSSCTQPPFVEFSWGEFESDPDVAFLGARVGQTEIDPDRQTAYPLDYPEPATMPTLNAEGGGKILVPWMADLELLSDDKWFAALVQGEHETFPAGWAVMQVNCGGGLYGWIKWIVDGHVIRQHIRLEPFPTATLCTDEHVMETYALDDLTDGFPYDGTATFPTITLKFVQFEELPPATSGDAPCGDEIPCSDPCTAEVYLYEGPGVEESTKAWRIKTRTGCGTPDCSCSGFAYSNCVPVFTLDGDAAVDHDVDFEKVVACNAISETSVNCESVPSTLTVTVGESSTVFNPPTPNTIGITCNSEAVSMELTFGCDGGCPTLDYNIAPGCAGSALLTEVASIDPLDVTYVIHAGGCCSETITIHVTE